MAETEGREKQDIGQDEAYIVNLKKIVELAADRDDRNRLWFDVIISQAVALNNNMTTAISGINSQMLGMVKQSRVPADKTAENIIGVNETDHIVGQILNSPWAEAMKTLMSQVIAASTKQSESKK
jgi:hypothetical protein